MHALTLGMQKQQITSFLLKIFSYAKESIVNMLWITTSKKTNNKGLSLNFLKLEYKRKNISAERCLLIILYAVWKQHWSKIYYQGMNKQHGNLDKMYFASHQWKIQEQAHQDMVFKSNWCWPKWISPSI